MPNLTIKNLPEDVHEALKRRARDHRRSLNQEVVEILAKESRRTALDVEAFLEDLNRFHRRSKSKWSYMTDEEINAAKREGRP